tara:strand:+ start:318 stop:683 length:366 start_codon:yes stop_codon:yes gene_type:complete
MSKIVSKGNPSWGSTIHCHPIDSVVLHRLAEFHGGISKVKAFESVCNLARLATPGFQAYLDEMNPGLHDRSEMPKTVWVPPSRGDQTPPPGVQRVFRGGIGKGYYEIDQNPPIRFREGGSR